MINDLLFFQTELSLRFELSGGFIKNAILSALSIAVSRDGENPVVCQKDLQQGANLQLRGALRMKVREGVRGGGGGGGAVVHVVGNEHRVIRVRAYA